MMTARESRMADIAFEESRHELGNPFPQPDPLVEAIKDALCSQELADEIFRLYCDGKKKGEL